MKLKQVLRLFLEVVGERAVRQFGRVYLVTVAMAATEVAGIASAAAFLQLISSGGSADLRWFAGLGTAIGLQNRTSLVVATGITLACFVVLAHSLALLGTWLQFRFAKDVDHQLAVRLLSAFAARPYQFFLRRNSADLGKQVLSEVNQFISLFLLPLMTFLSTATISLVIIGLLFVVEPVVTGLASVVFGGTYAMIYYGIRRRLDGLADARLDAVRTRFRTATELLTGIKAVKIHSAEAPFVDRFADGSQVYTSVHATISVLTAAPRYIVETLVFAGVAGVLIAAALLGQSLAAIVPVLTLYVLAAYRLLPQVQKLYHAAATIRFSLPLLEDVHRDLTDGGVPPSSGGRAHPLPTEVRFDSEIAVAGVCFTYEGSDLEVLRDISLTIPKNSSAGFVGETGCGKSTLVDLLIGLIEPGKGRVCVDGVTIDSATAADWRTMVGYVPQDVFLFDDTIANNIAFTLTSSNVDMDRLLRVARVAQIHDFIVSDLPEGYHTQIGERGVRLSGGQRQRLGLARALYRQPAVLILDEATSALDTITEDAVLRAVRNELSDVTLIVIAHRLSTVKNCDQLYMMDGGRIAAGGTYDDLLAREARFQNLVTVAS